MLIIDFIDLEKYRLIESNREKIKVAKELSLPEHTTPLRQWSFWQCLPSSCSALGVKHCRHPIAALGVVDTFGPSLHIKRMWLVPNHKSSEGFFSEKL